MSTIHAVQERDTVSAPQIITAKQIVCANLAIDLQAGSNTEATKIGLLLLAGTITEACGELLSMDTDALRVTDKFAAEIHEAEINL